MGVTAYVIKDEAGNETLRFNNRRATIGQGVGEVLSQLSAAQMMYAGSIRRGAYRGFAALHDFCDANMLLPGADKIDNTEECLVYWNRVMDVVTGYLMALYDNSDLDEVTRGRLRNEM